jgi:hypothetical protein
MRSYSFDLDGLDSSEKYSRKPWKVPCLPLAAGSASALLIAYLTFKINRVDSVLTITCSNRSLCHHARRSVERTRLPPNRSLVKRIDRRRRPSLSLSSSYSVQYRIYIGACCPNKISPHVLKLSTQNLDRYAGASNKICTQDYIGARSPEQDLLPHTVPCVCVRSTHEEVRGLPIRLSTNARRVGRRRSPSGFESQEISDLLHNQ